MESKGEHRNKFDIKQAMLPIVDYARVYALKHGVAETNTLERLQLLMQKGVISSQGLQRNRAGIQLPDAAAVGPAGRRHSR
ncbi:MAG: hypothetical protein MZV70_64475 [Desulfobacterales bacterium]|nr:hypothetical protein [Desulfobacterales bacterium]